MEKNRVIVTIYGKEYSLVSEVDPNYIMKTASYLDSKMREVSENYPTIPEARVAVLAALNIVDELFHNRDSMASLPEQEQCLRDLTRMLSEVL
jgi:cell division protein ZapA